MQTLSLKEMLPEITDAQIKASKLKYKISKALNKKRKQLNMSQQEFAKHLGVSQGMISKWESFGYNFSIESLCEILCKLDIDFDIQINDNIQAYKKSNTTTFKYCDYSNNFVGWSGPITNKLGKAG